MTWAAFCESPGRALDLLRDREQVEIEAGRVLLVLTRRGLASDRVHQLTVSVTALKDGRERTRADVRAALERDEVVGISRHGWREGMIERSP